MVAGPPPTATRVQLGLFDRPDGEVIGRYSKTFLWHFDSKWFAAGDEYRVFDTPLGRIGILICADGRLPEIARVLALKGAEIIVDPTNWVTTGKDLESLRNAQPDWIIPTRALENGVWFLCANKVGWEAESVVYCGQSLVASPDGAVQVKGSSGSPEIITATVDVTRDSGRAAALGREVGSGGVLASSRRTTGFRRLPC